MAKQTHAYVRHTKKMDISLPPDFVRPLENYDACVYDVNGRYMPHEGDISKQDLYTGTDGIILENEYIGDQVHIWQETAEDKDKVITNLRANGTRGKITTGVIYYTIVFESRSRMCCFLGEPVPLCQYRRVLAIKEEEI